MQKRIIGFIVVIAMFTVLLPSLPVLAYNREYQTISIGHAHTMVIKTDGSLWGWGANGVGELSNNCNAEKSFVPIKIMDSIKSVLADYDFTVAIKEDGSLWGWGSNYYGQLGDGEERGFLRGQYRPEKIMDNVASVRTYNKCTMAIKTDGSLWAWGEDYNRGLVDNDMVKSSYVPVKIMDNILSFSATSDFVSVIKTDGSLWTWGENLDGTHEETHAPVKIMDDVIAIEGSSYNFAILQRDGSLWICGENCYGQSSNGYDSVTHIMDNVVDISVDWDYTMAIKEDGSLWGWGSNFNGQLGDGTNEDKFIPTKIMDNVVMAETNGGTSLAIKSDGTLWSWGWNHFGQLGDGDDETYSRERPKKIMDNVAYVLGDGTSTIAIKNDGTLWVWGSNGYDGKLGVGDSTDRCIPVKIMNNVELPQINRTIPIGIEEPQPVPTPEATFSGLAEKTEISIGGTETYSGLVTLNRANAKLTIDDNSVATIEKFIYVSNEDGTYDEETSFDIIPKAPGEARLTATAPDGSILTGKLIITPVIAETITDETILKAKILSENERYHYYKNVYNNPAMQLYDAFIEDGTITTAESYLLLDDILNVLTLKLEDGENLKKEKYYEMILADMLENDEDGVWDNIYSKWRTVYKGYNNTLTQKVINKVGDIDKVKASKFFTKNNQRKVWDIITDYSNEQGVLKEVTIEVGVLDKLSLSVDLVSDFFDALDEMYAYSAMEQEKIDVLKQIQSRTQDSDLKKACRNLIEDIQFAHENAVLYFASHFTESSMKDIMDFSSGIVTGVVLDYITTDTAGLTPYVPGLSEAMKIVKGGQFVSDKILNAGSISEKVLKVSAYAEIEKEVKMCASVQETAFNLEPTVEHAMDFMAAADLMKIVLLESHDVYIDCAKEVKKADGHIELLKAILLQDAKWYIEKTLKNNTYDDKIKSCEGLKQMLKDADFYNNYDDVSQYISVIRSTTPSSWAQPFVDKAINYNILYDYMQNNYQNNITRAEFCTLLTAMIEAYTDENIYNLINKKGTDTDLFKDTFYEYVYCMARLGIVAGVSETEFQPLGFITREQAATMLMRAAKVLDIDTSAPDTNLDGVSVWAKEGVNFVVDNDIMTGTNNGFEPQGTYTKEQAITTMVRFYENLR